MKKILTLLVVFSFAFLVPPPSTHAAKPATNGFDQYGYNYTAHLFNAWYGQWGWKYLGYNPGTWDAWLNMKWSTDWIPQADEPVGAWVTNHFNWYSNDYDEVNWYGFNTRVSWTSHAVAPQAKYKLTEFAKIMSVGDNPEEWERYHTGGAYDAQWGSYPDGTPRYIVFQDVISVYQRQWNLSGNWIWDFEYLGGHYAHDASLTQTGNAITGSGGYPTGSSSYSYAWQITSATVNGDTVNFTMDYTVGAVGTTMTMMGTINPDGTMSGTWSDNYGGPRTGTWTSTSGAGVYDFDNLLTTFNLSKASPRGLGKPIF